MLLFFSTSYPLIPVNRVQSTDIIFFVRIDNNFLFRPIEIASISIDYVSLLIHVSVSLFDFLNFVFLMCVVFVRFLFKFSARPMLPFNGEIKLCLM